MQKSLKTLGLECGTLGLTARKELVLFFDREEREVFQDVVKKCMVRESSICLRSSISDLEL
jgi:hypothetical protein